jgi:hypothetical protein
MVLLEFLAFSDQDAFKIFCFIGKLVFFQRLKLFQHQHKTFLDHLLFNWGDELLL